MPFRATVTHLFLLLLFFYFSNEIYAQEKELSFRHYGVEKGLTQNTVFSVLQDQKGYIWIGTRNGLNRYDTHRFHQYRTAVGDSTALRNNAIHALASTDAALWVGTQQGLYTYDYGKDQLSYIAFPQGKSYKVNALLSDTQGQLWVGTPEGLFLYHSLTGKWISVASGEQQAFLSSEITALGMSAHQQALWVAGPEGIGVLNLGNQSYALQKLSLRKGKQAVELSKAISSIYVINEDAIWITSRGEGVLKMTAKGEIIQQLSMERQTLLHDDVRALEQDEQGRLWIGTFKGITVYDPTTEETFHIQHDPDDENSLSGNSIYSLYRDQKGSMWVGTYHQGINFMDESNRNFQHYTCSRLRNSVSHWVVSALEEDPQGSLWVGTEGGGLNYFDRKTKQFTHWKKSDTPYGLSADNVKGLLLDQEGDLWIGTYKGGLNIKQSTTGKFLNHKNSTQPIFSFPHVYAFEEDKRQQQVWVGTYGQGVFQVDKHTLEILKQWVPDASNTLPSDEIRALLQDEKGRLWIGSEKGLSVKAGATWVSFAGEIQTAVYCLFEDQQHRVWVGTYGEGLFCFDQNFKKLYHFHEENGLQGGRVMGIMPGEKGLWLTTNKGLSILEETSGTFKDYGVAEGLLGETMGYNSYLRTKDGELFFGGGWGLTSFDPKTMAHNDFSPPVVFTDFRLFNKSLQVDEEGLLKQHISETHEVVLDYDQNVIAVEFAALNYVQPEKNQYAFKLEGFEEDWVYTNTPIATYTNLDPGVYHLMVKASNNDNLWNKRPLELRIEVLPPLWKRWWAFLIYGAIILLALYLLAKLVRTRTHLIHDLHMEHMEMEKRDELYQAKMQFFTNISHEIRTPLTMITAPLEQALRMAQRDQPLLEKLTLVNKHTERLLQLINQLLDFRKQETGHMKLRRGVGNFVRFVEEITITFREQALLKEVNLSFETEATEMPLIYDRGQMEKVLYNLLSNALKYTSKHGQIKVALQTKEASDTFPQGALVLRIQDNGIGIPEDYLSDIFDRYYRIGESMQVNGTGIGLALAKGIVELHGGMIEAESTMKTEGQEGCTTFTIQLPLGEEHISEEELLDTFDEPSTSWSRFLVEKENSIEEDILSDRVVTAEKHHTILLVEDNQEIRRYMSTLLQETYHVLQAPNGQVGWELAQRHLPDLVISDVMMPVMDGIHLCKMIKTTVDTSHIPVILLTARTGLVHQLTGLETGADDYITKPFEVKILLARVNNMIASRAILRDKFSTQPYQVAENFAKSSADKVFMEKVMKVLEEYMADPDFNVARLVEEMGMSKPVLYRKIKALTDLSIIDFMKSIRLKKAAYLLQHTDKQIAEIAYEVGYSDPKYFTKSFKQAYDTPPSEYRKADLVETPY
ncbi:two-component regulator propeller domain-containing protein [Algivirga pacifica]|uniref:histidine kinase n=1 Tax=Algivirga pacifica TaxID=1162670 RepID=A0ABP9D389_9BACT